MNNLPHLKVGKSDAALDHEGNFWSGVVCQSPLYVGERLANVVRYWELMAKAQLPNKPASRLAWARAEMKKYECDPHNYVYRSREEQDQDQGRQRLMELYEEIDQMMERPALRSELARIRTDLLAVETYSLKTPFSPSQWQEVITRVRADLDKLSGRQDEPQQQPAQQQQLQPDPAAALAQLIARHDDLGRQIDALKKQIKKGGT